MSELIRHAANQAVPYVTPAVRAAGRHLRIQLQNEAARRLGEMGLDMTRNIRRALAETAHRYARETGGRISEVGSRVRDYMIDSTVFNRDRTIPPLYDLSNVEIVEGPDGAQVAQLVRRPQSGQIVGRDHAADAPLPPRQQRRPQPGFYESVTNNLQRQAARAAGKAVVNAGVSAGMNAIFPNNTPPAYQKPIGERKNIPVSSPNKTSGSYSSGKPKKARPMAGGKYMSSFLDPVNSHAKSWPDQFTSETVPVKLTQTHPVTVDLAGATAGAFGITFRPRLHDHYADIIVGSQGGFNNATNNLNLINHEDHPTIIEQFERYRITSMSVTVRYVGRTDSKAGRIFIIGQHLGAPGETSGGNIAQWGEDGHGVELSTAKLPHEVVALPYDKPVFRTTTEDNSDYFGFINVGGIGINTSADDATVITITTVLHLECLPKYGKFSRMIARPSPHVPAALNHRLPSFLHKHGARRKTITAGSKVRRRRPSRRKSNRRPAKKPRIGGRRL